MVLRASLEEALPKSSPARQDRPMLARSIRLLTRRQVGASSPEVASSKLGPRRGEGICRPCWTEGPGAGVQRGDGRRYGADGVAQPCLLAAIDEVCSTTARARSALRQGLQRACVQVHTPYACLMPSQQQYAPSCAPWCSPWCSRRANSALGRRPETGPRREARHASSLQGVRWWHLQAQHGANRCQVNEAKKAVASPAWFCPQARQRAHDRDFNCSGCYLPRQIVPRSNPSLETLVETLVGPWFAQVRIFTSGWLFYLTLSKSRARLP